MKRTLATILGVVLLLTFSTGSASAQSGPSNKTETIAKTDTDQTDPLVKVDAMVKPDATVQIDPMIKMDPHKGRGVMKPGVQPSPDGHDLATSCKAEVEGFDAGYCLGVVEGVIAFMRLCKQDHSVITLGEAADATARYLENHPNKLKERDVVLARRALSKAYPCGPSR